METEFSLVKKGPSIIRILGNSFYEATHKGLEHHHFFFLFEISQQIWSLEASKVLAETFDIFSDCICWDISKRKKKWWGSRPIWYRQTKKRNQNSSTDFQPSLQIIQFLDILIDSIILVLNFISSLWLIHRLLWLGWHVCQQDGWRWKKLALIKKTYKNT